MPVIGILSIRVLIAFLEDFQQNSIYEKITKSQVDEIVRKALITENPEYYLQIKKIESIES